MRKARIEGGKVAEILDAEPFPEFHPSLLWVECEGSVAEGDLYDNGQFAKPEPPVPQVVSRFQARAALHLAGLLESVEAMMSAPQTDALVKLAWADAQEFKRNSPTVLALSAQLGLTDEQIDQLFITAAGIEA